MSMGCHEILHLIVEPHSRAQPGNTELKTIYQKEISPDIIVKGGDYSAKDVIGGDLCKVQIFEILDGYSTTNIIDRIRSQ
jgi:bifunctional ADP-heptose synthase (sugar kinase/adenylyltransferase)